MSPTTKRWLRHNSHASDPTDQQEVGRPTVFQSGSGFEDASARLPHRRAHQQPLDRRRDRTAPGGARGASEGEVGCRG